MAITTLLERDMADAMLEAVICCEQCRFEKPKSSRRCARCQTFLALLDRVVEEPNRELLKAAKKVMDHRQDFLGGDGPTWAAAPYMPLGQALKDLGEAIEKVEGRS